MSGECYGVFASVYDKLTENVEYRRRGEYVQSLIKKYGGKQYGELLDLACGTGSLSEFFCEMGYSVTGADISEDMLSIAENKRIARDLPIKYIHQDMRELELPHKTDITLCMLDSLNHLDGMDDVKMVFDRVYRQMDSGGLFIFDMNTLYKHHHVLGNNTFVYDEEEVYLVWQNFLDGDRVDISLDIFLPRDNGDYERYCEDFSETAYPLESVKQALEQSGFGLLDIFGENTSDAPDEKTERAVFVAEKGTEGE